MYSFCKRKSDPSAIVWTISVAYQLVAEGKQEVLSSEKRFYFNQSNTYIGYDDVYTVPFSRYLK
jgi:hypothetical protein